MRVTSTIQYNNRNNNRNYSAKNVSTDVSFGNLAQVKNAVNKVSNKGTDAMAYGLGHLASWKPFQSVVHYLKNKNYEEHLAAFVGCVISGFYMLDTAKSKNIEKDQKMPLIMNQGIVCGLSTLGGYTLNRYLNKKLNGLTETFHISQIENKELQKEFLKAKADYSYMETFRENMDNRPAFKNIFENIDAKFEFNNNARVYLKEELKKHPDDVVAKEFLEEIKTAKPTATMDKAEVIKEMFMRRKDGSKALQGVYNRSLMNNAISNLANLEKKANDAKELAKFTGEELAEMTKLKGGRLTNMMNGFRIARALMVFALIYRFVSPVFATPLANKLSEKVENRKKVA